jgi:hypothetical protein
MRFWTRELAGWLLIGLGLYTFLTCYRLLTQHYILEGGSLTVIGVFLFRGGLHLLKVAVAARVCMESVMSEPPRDLARRGPRPLSVRTTGRSEPVSRPS